MKKLRGDTRMSHYTMIDEWPPPRMYALPKEWLLRIRRTMKKGQSDHSFLTWFLKQYKKGRPGVVLEPRLTWADATDFCEMFLGTMDKGHWPVLLGINPVMDSLLGKKFRTEDLSYFFDA